MCRSCQLIGEVDVNTLDRHPMMMPMLAQAPAGSANIEVGNQLLISSHDRIEIQEKLLNGYAYAADSKVV